MKTAENRASNLIWSVILTIGVLMILFISIAQIGVEKPPEPKPSFYKLQKPLNYGTD